MARRKVSNPLALAVLTHLFERPMHPYEIASTLRKRHKEESIKLNYGSLYTVVEQLQRHGLIEPRETVQEGRRPERTVYALTDAGRVEAINWLSELLSTPVKEYTRFEAGLSLMAVLPPDDVAALLEERRQRLELELRSMRSTREMAGEHGLPRLFLLESEYVMMLRQAELEWVTQLVGEIRDGSLEGMEHWREFHEPPGAEGGEVTSLDDRRKA